MADIKIISGDIHFEGYKVAELIEQSVPKTVVAKFTEALKNCYSNDEIEQMKAEAYERGYDAGYELASDVA